MFRRWQAGRVVKNRKRGNTAKGEVYPGVLGQLPSPSRAFEDPGRPLVGVSPGDWRASIQSDGAALLDHTRCSFRLLVKHYGIAEDDPEAMFKLALALARAHVPAFQMDKALEMSRARRAKKPTKLGAAEIGLLHLVVEIEKINKLRPLDKEEAEGLQTAQQLLENTKLAKRTMRDLKKQLASAQSDYWNDEATDFQRKYMEIVLPAIREMWPK